MNPNVLITNAKIITPSITYEHGWLLTSDSKIALIGHGEPPEFMDVTTIDADGLYAMPGFIDVHAHGGNGYESMDASIESLRQIAHFYAKHGVTAFLATTWTASRERIHDALSTIAAAQGTQPEGATLIGAHLEGPYLNPSRCGAQDTQQIRHAIEEEARTFLDLDVIRLLALAPEYKENLWLISECVRQGITVSAAHTASTYEDIQQAVKLGLSQSTHTFNAMTPLNHRQPGTVGAVLTMPEIYCELIADNIHVHPAVMRLLLAAKGVERIILITDAVRGAGLPAGSNYEQDGRTVTLRDGGAYLNDETLAGSTLTMDKALYNFGRATGQPLESIWRTTSANAAQSLHITHRKGSLEVGKDADIILVDENIVIQMTMAEGKIVYRKNL